MRYAIVIDATEVVENLIELEPGSDYPLSAGLSLVPATDQAEPGGTWSGGQFHRAVIDPQPMPVISARQVRLALTAAGLREQVEAAVEAADQATQDHWFYSTELHRDHPLIVSMAASLGMTEAQIDALWFDASQR